MTQLVNKATDKLSGGVSTADCQRDGDSIARHASVDALTAPSPTVAPSFPAPANSRLAARVYPGEPVPERSKTNLDFTEARDSEWQWHQLGHMQVCTLLQTDNHASTPLLSFYRPDALPAAQPTASNH